MAPPEPARPRPRRFPPPATPAQLDCAVLEPRVLLSVSPLVVESPQADGQPGPADDAVAAAAHSPFEASTDIGAAPADRLDATTAPSSEPTVGPIDDHSPPSRLELVLIDTAVEHYAQLVDDLVSQGDGWRRLEVVLLDAYSDGIDQITAALGGYSQVDAVHVISHGASGALRVGDTWLTAATLSTYADRIESWNASLAAGADLLLYGCDLAGGPEGRALLDALHAMTGVDVAASTNATGAGRLGGDWQLEVLLGQVETAVAVSSATQQEWQSLLAVVTVNTTSDEDDGDTSSIAALIAAPGLDGVISLREAISAANNNVGPDAIVFNIGGGGHQTIQVLAALPAITGDLTLDATTQTGYAGIPLIELDGSLAGAGADGLRISGGNTIIRGFAINRFAGHGVSITAAGGNIIESNYIGTDVTGLIDLGNGGAGIVVDGNGNIIRNNLISGNDGHGIQLAAGASNNTIRGNLIGTDATGTGALGNLGDGIRLGAGASGSIIGGTAAGQGNTIAFNTGGGIVLEGSAGTGNAIRRNVIFENSQLGIDLGADGVTLNDGDDSDGGANSLQNFPVLSAASTTAGDITITGTLQSTPATNFVIEFFASPAADPTGYGEGRVYLGSKGVSTDGSGTAAINATLAVVVPDGWAITATATNLASGNTSEFSGNVTATAAGNSAPTSSDYTVSTVEDVAYTFSVADFSYFDPDGDPFQQIRITSLASAGSLELAGVPVGLNQVVLASAVALGDLRFVPAVDEAGTAYASFRYEVHDGTQYSTSSYTVTVDVTPVNDQPPVAASHSLTVAEGGTAGEADLDAGTNLLDGVTDPDLPLDAHTLDTTPVAGPAHGTLLLFADGRFQYTHDGSENFSDAFTFRVWDAAGHSSTATVTITVTPVNDQPPVAASHSLTVAEGGTASEADLDAGTNLLDGVTDPDLPLDAHTLDTTPVAGPAHGSLVLQADGRFLYTHDGSENFSDAFTFRVWDAGGQGATATVAITVTPVDDPPVGLADSYMTTESTPLIVSLAAGVLANDVDPEGASLTAVLASLPSNGWLALAADGSFSYVPAAGFVGIDTFSYTAHSGTWWSAAISVDITVVSSRIGPSPDARRYEPVDGLVVPGHGEEAGAGIGPATRAASDEQAAAQGAPKAIEAGGNQGRGIPVGRGVVARETARAAYPRDLVGIQPGVRSQEDLWNIELVSPPDLGGSTPEADGEGFDYLALMAEDGTLVYELDGFRLQVFERYRFPVLLVAGTLAGTLGLTVGYVAWTIRGGHLLASILAQMPAWRLIDPLPVLEYPVPAAGEPKDRDEETLQSIVEAEGEHEHDASYG